MPVVHGQAGQQVQHDGLNIIHRQRAASGQMVAQALAVHELHHEVVGAGVGALVEDVHDVGVGELCQRFCLAPEAFIEFLVAPLVGAYDLDCDVTLK